MAFELLQTQPKPPANKPREKGLQRGRCLRSARRSPVLRPRGSHSVPDSRTQKPPLPRVPPEEAAHPEAVALAAEPGTPRSAPEGPVLGLGARAPCGAAPGGRVGALGGGRWAPPGTTAGVVLGPKELRLSPEGGSARRPRRPRPRRGSFGCGAAARGSWRPRPERPSRLTGQARREAALAAQGRHPRAPFHFALGPGARRCGGVCASGSPAWACGLAAHGRARGRDRTSPCAPAAARPSPRPRPLRSPPAPHAPPFPVRSAEGAAGRAGRGLPPGVPGLASRARAGGTPRPPTASRRARAARSTSRTEAFKTSFVVFRGRAEAGAEQLPPRPPEPPPPPGNRNRRSGARPGFRSAPLPAPGAPRGGRGGVRAAAAQACAGPASGRGAPAAAELGAGSARAARRAQRRRQVPARGSGRAAPARRPHGRAGNAKQHTAPSRTARPGTAAGPGRGTQGPPLPLRSGAAGHGAEGAALAGVPVGPPPPPPRAFPAAAAASPRAGDPAGAAGREQEREQEQEHEHERPRARLSPHPPVGGRAAGGASVHTAGQHGSARRRRVHTAGRAARSPSAQPRPARAPHVCAPRRALEPALSPGPWPRAVCGRARRPGRGARPGPTGPSDRLTPPSFSPSLISLTPTSLYSYPHLGLETLGFPGPCPCLVATGPGCPQQLPRAGQGGRRPQRA
ncbi:collagen alpha-1(I) chain-like isoform X1 [Canis lupus familiaris]|uniref:collagen alpha-1(I) chain-like isoform X1 n=1 Tax=Canis lupus familiaris TaxID=9615 RepID=UPI0018F7D1B3|nr:collagen alpha-1(I) chain-like isoform X1 [Canis lupus familiaris]